MTQPVGNRHESHAADPRLDVLERGVDRRRGAQRLKCGRQGVEKALEGGIDVDDTVLNTQSLRKGRRIRKTPFGGVAGWHRDPQHLVGSEGLGGHGGDQRTVHAARQAQNRLPKPTLARVVADAQHKTVERGTRIRFRLRRDRLLWQQLAHEHMLREPLRARPQIARRPEDGGGAVENQVVGGTHQVREQQGACLLPGNSGEHVLPRRTLGQRKRRCR